MTAVLDRRVAGLYNPNPWYKRNNNTDTLWETFDFLDDISNVEWSSLSALREHMHYHIKNYYCNSGSDIERDIINKGLASALFTQIKSTVDSQIIECNHYKRFRPLDPSDNVDSHIPTHFKFFARERMTYRELTNRMVQDFMSADNT